MAAGLRALLALILCGVLVAARPTGAAACGTPAATPATIEVYAAMEWYRARPEPEEEFRGTLRRREVARDVRLVLVEEDGELADGQLLRGREREQTKPHRFREDPIELPARRLGLRAGHHRFYIFCHSHERK